MAKEGQVDVGHFDRIDADGYPGAARLLGTKQPAEQGQLIVLASGPEEVRERSEQVFSAVGSKTVWLGEAGEGSRLKLVINNWIVGLLGVLAETVAFAEVFEVVVAPPLL